MNLTVALTGAALVVCIVIFASCLTRVLGFGMMDENETATSQDNTPETTFAQNQANCLNLDDGWWSPIAGPIVVKACGSSANTGENSKLQVLSKQTETSTSSQSTKESNTETQPTTETSTTSTPATQTESSTPPTDVTETQDKKGNTILSSTIQDMTITAISSIQSTQEDLRIPEIAQQVLDADKKDYNKGVIEGIKFAFRYGEAFGKKSNEITEQQSKLTPEQINASRSLSVQGFVLQTSEGKSGAYILGYSRGLTLGADFVTTTGLAGISHKQKAQ